MAGEDADEVRREFRELVNMPPKELEDWLRTDESKSVGQKDGDDESTGHEMGRHIARIEQTKKADLRDTDLERMRRVTGYIKRHLAQRPSHEDVETSRWRYSLKNWGHDPLR